MSDDDNTPTERPFRKPRIQTSDDRGAAALQRRSMATTTPAETVPMPIIEEDPADMTGPFDLFEPARSERRKRPSDSVAELAAKLRHDKPDAYELIAMLGFEHLEAKEAARRERRATESQSKEIDAQFKAFLAQQPCGKEFEDLRSTVKLWKYIGGAILTLAIGSVGLGLSALWSRAEHEGSTATKIDRLQQDVQQLIRGEFASRHQPQGPTP